MSLTACVTGMVTRITKDRCAILLSLLLTGHLSKQCKVRFSIYIYLYSILKKTCSGICQIKHKRSLIKSRPNTVQHKLIYIYIIKKTCVNIRYYSIYRFFYCINCLLTVISLKRVLHLKHIWYAQWPCISINLFIHSYIHSFIYLFLHLFIYFHILTFL